MTKTPNLNDDDALEKLYRDVKKVNMKDHGDNEKMELQKVTPEDIYSWNPYFDPRKIEKLYGRGGGADAIDILNCEEISISNKFWCVLRPEMLPEKVLGLFAIVCAEHNLHFYEDRYPADDRPRKAVDTLKQFLKGDVPENVLYAAHVVAKNASENARCDAGEKAVWAPHVGVATLVSYVSDWHKNLARQVAMYSSDTGAKIAQNATTRVEDETSAWNTEKQWQLKMLLSLIDEESAG
jgi:hypothetical protein